MRREKKRKTKKGWQLRIHREKRKYKTQMTFHLECANCITFSSFSASRTLSFSLLLQSNSSIVPGSFSKQCHASSKGFIASHAFFTKNHCSSLFMAITLRSFRLYPLSILSALFSLRQCLCVKSISEWKKFFFFLLFSSWKQAVEKKRSVEF